MSPQQRDREQGDLISLLSSCVTSQQPLRAALAGAEAGEALGICFRLLNLVEKLEVWLTPANQMWAGKCVLSLLCRDSGEACNQKLVLGYNQTLSTLRCVVIDCFVS